MKNALLLGSLLFASSLASAQANKPNFYLLCENSTGLELNEATALQCVDSLCIDLSLSFQVKEEAKDLPLTDSCRLLRTEVAGQVDDQTKSYVPYVERSGAEPVIGKIVAPGMGRLYPGEAFAVEFPMPGAYLLTVTLGRGSLRFEKLAP